MRGREVCRASKHFELSGDGDDDQSKYTLMADLEPSFAPLGFDRVAVMDGQQELGGIDTKQPVTLGSMVRNAMVASVCPGLNVTVPDLGRTSPASPIHSRSLSIASGPSDVRNRTVTLTAEALLNFRPIGPAYGYCTDSSNFTVGTVATTPVARWTVGDAAAAGTPGSTNPASRPPTASTASADDHKPCGRRPLSDPLTLDRDIQTSPRTLELGHRTPNVALRCRRQTKERRSPTPRCVLKGEW
jgi:hypothetical protein